MEETKGNEQDISGVRCNDLLSCPFCGETEVEEMTVTIIFANSDLPDKYDVTDGTDRSVYCWNCGANTLVKWWNQRAR